MVRTVTDRTESSAAYEVKLPVFEGPLDLLLHLIREHRIDIYDIPITMITQQYLDYLELMSDLNLSVAGEFLVMAATLLQIKSRTLLPREEHAESADEGEDPREELVRRLVEYQRYKEAAVVLEEREIHWRDVFRREQEPLEVEPEDVQLGEVSLFDLLTALRGVLERVPDQSIMEVTIEALTVRDRMTQILERLDRIEAGEELSFDRLFDADGSRIAVIVTFLAVLELVKIHVLGLRQSAGGPIAVRRLGALDATDHDPGAEPTETDEGANGNG